ncbi:MAG: MFS transporter, partial [Halanaeroarchaeum sp.]
GALMAPATMALVTDMADATERGVAMAGFNVFGSLGFLAGILAGGTIAAERGFRDAFLAVGGIEVAIALVMIPFFVSWRRRSPADGDGADETGETGQTDESPS